TVRVGGARCRLMPPEQVPSVIHYLRQVVASATALGVPDAQLLARYINDRDEPAFELLVWRHAQTVLGTCRRVVRNEQDAHDCFQATFLALARQARSIGQRESVGGWLYKVAYRIALKARGRSMRRAAREQPIGDSEAPSPH